MRPSFFHHLHPPTIPAPQARWRYTLGAGGLAVFLSLVLVVTGALEMFFYVPTPENAAASIQALTFLVPFGSLVRNLHYWAAQILVLVVLVHLLRVVFTGAYVRPRRFNYLLGLSLLVICLFLDFTGYVLRWDEGIHWALVTGTNLVKSIPVIGPGLYGMLVGGSQPGAATLVRFYAWHIFGLTLVLILVGGWHLFRVRRDGGIAVPPPEDRRDHRRISRFELVRREVLAALLAAVGLIVLALLRPAPLSPAIQAGISNTVDTALLGFSYGFSSFCGWAIPSCGVSWSSWGIGLAGDHPLLTSVSQSAGAGRLVPARQPACSGLGGLARHRHLGSYIVIPATGQPRLTGLRMRRSIVLASAALLLVLLAAAWIQYRRPRPVALTPALTGQVEYCLTCHGDLPEISKSHPVQTFGCVRCHGGERLALNADLAHSSMRGGANPSDLSVAEASCGGSDCHSGTAAANSDHIQRVKTSIQATYAGAFAQILYTFGAQPDLNARYGVYAVQAYQKTTPRSLPYLLVFTPDQTTSPSIKTFLEQCQTCHITAEPIPGGQYQRFIGCSTCHTPTANRDPQQLIHQLTTAMPYTQCNTCHNRGNYDLRSMQFQPRTDTPSDRLHDYYQPIAQFTRCEWTLDCVDCHTRQEAMGDGNLYGHKKDIQYIQCRTCHGTLDEPPLTAKVESPDDLAMRLAFLNPVIDLMVGDTILVTQKGEPLWNTRQLPDGTYELFDKVTGERFTFRPVKGTACQQKPDQQESRYCHECHAVQR